MSNFMSSSLFLSSPLFSLAPPSLLSSHTQSRLGVGVGTEFSPSVRFGDSKVLLYDAEEDLVTTPVR